MSNPHAINMPSFVWEYFWW